MSSQLSTFFKSAVATATIASTGRSLPAQKRTRSAKANESPAVLVVSRAPLNDTILR